MKVVTINCPNCNASIKNHTGGKKFYCEYCGSAVSLEEEATKVKHIMEGQITEEQEFINAETFLNKVKDYDTSYDLYKSLSKKYANDHELWIGLLRSLTHDFTYKETGDRFQKEYQKYWRAFIALAPEKDIKKYQDKYKNYVDNVRATYNNGFTQQVNDISSSFNLNDISKEIDKIGNIKLDEGLGYFLIVFFVGMFGVHKFIKGEVGMGVLYFFTGGLFGIGWIIDIIKAGVELNKK